MTYNIKIKILNEKSFRKYMPIGAVWTESNPICVDEPSSVRILGEMVCDNDIGESYLKQWSERAESQFCQMTVQGGAGEHIIEGKFTISELESAKAGSYRVTIASAGQCQTLDPAYA